MDEVKLLPCLDDDVRRRLFSVATTLETCGKHGIPIDFAMLAHDIRAAIEATRPPIVTDEVVERVKAAIEEGISPMHLMQGYLYAAARAAIAALPTIDQDGGE